MMELLLGGYAVWRAAEMTCALAVPQDRIGDGGPARPVDCAESGVNDAGRDFGISQSGRATAAGPAHPVLGSDCGRRRPSPKVSLL